MQLNPYVNLLYTRIRLTLMLWHCSYVYAPKTNHNTDIRRLIRIYLVLAVIVVFVYQQHHTTYFYNLLLPPNQNKTQHINSTSKTSQAKQENSAQKQQNAQQTNARYYLVRPANALNVRDIVLIKRIQERQKRITQLAITPTHTNQAVQNAHFDNYEHTVEQSLVAAGNALYQKLYGRTGLDGQGILQFTIHTDGTISQVRITKSSGSMLIDQLLIDAAQQAAPFAPLPEGKKQHNITRAIRLSPY